MSEVVSFSGYTPAPRFDGIAWAKVKVEEAPSADGSWTQIDLITLSPVDADPTNPAVRNVTTALGTAPDLWYRLTFQDAGGGVSLPTDPVQNADAVTSRLYISRDEMKTALGMNSQTYADADIDRACNAVSRAIDQAVRGPGNHFYQATETRYYTPDEFNCTYYEGPYLAGGHHHLEIEDLVSATSVTIDAAGDGSYNTTWVEGTDFFLDPANAPTDGQPFEELTLRARGGRYFPTVQRGVKITGTFGWPVVPAQVSQYAVFFVSQTVLRTRQAPFGVLMQGMEIGVTARLMRVDPDFGRFLGSLTRTKVFI